MANPKVRRPDGPDGGDTLEVIEGGRVVIFSGGTIQASGGQAAHIADATGVATGATTLVGKFNVVLAALRGVGVLATQ